LITMIKNQGDELAAKDKEIERLRKELEKYNSTCGAEKKSASKAVSAKKAASTKKATPKKK
ncbi:MAG: alpha-amylase, partial [Bacteroidaceae bacterium]|nr:alpha-amylase [Bacteroidaceae bacterium]